MYLVLMKPQYETSFETQHNCYGLKDPFEAKRALEAGHIIYKLDILPRITEINIDVGVRESVE